MIDSNSPEPEVLIDRALEVVRQINQSTDGVGNKVHAFDISEHASDDDDALAEYIQNALANNRFKLRYQPIYDINTDSSDLFEVYVTLPMADGSELTLDKFSQLAKNTICLINLTVGCLSMLVKHLPLLVNNTRMLAC